MAVDDKHISYRIYLVAVFIFLMAIAIVVKLTNIQWVEGDYYRKLAKQRTVRNFVIPANKGNIYSADGSLLATSIPNYEIRFDAKAPKTDSFIVPRKPLNLLKNALPDNEDPITISYNSNHLFVNHGSTQMICRLIDARFPDYKVVIPADNPYRLTVNKHDFQNALRRVNVFSNKSTNQVALNITGNELQMAAQDIDFSFEGNERMSCEYQGEDIQIAFNAKFLIEMLNAADTDEVFIELSTPSKAGLIKPSEQVPGEDLLMLVMPLMLNS